jgi:hypothetical protein
MQSSRLTVPIRPEVGMYAAFARMRYEPWFALAEFVDNALQSHRANRARLAEADGGFGPLRIEVRIDSDLIRVTDAAAGIAVADMPRAFAPAMPPPDRSGLSEFGIGMKAAACWFADRWTVRTCALGEGVERTLTFDVPRIVAESTEELLVEERRANTSDHYTVLELTRLRDQPKGRTVGKIREHLSSIYRAYIRQGELELTFTTASGSELLGHREPALLTAPHFKKPSSPPVLWKKDINLDVGGGQRVWGWAGLLARASTSHAGFAILRRGRVIEGSVENTWRPEYIFKKPNSYTYQRLVGELQVEGFNVSFSKDGIRWGEYEEEVLQLLLEELDKDPLPLVRQAEGMRVRKKAREVKPGFGQKAVDATSQDIETRAPPVLGGQIDAPAEDPAEAPPQAELPGEVMANRVLEVRPHSDQRLWRITIEVVRERPADWYTCSVPARAEGVAEDVWTMLIRLNLDHPFSEQYINEDESRLEPIVRIVAGLALAELTAREAGTKHAGRVRHHFNELLRSALSHPTETSDG